MKQTPQIRRAPWLLLAAAALPLSPALAQDTTTAQPAQPPATAPEPAQPQVQPTPEPVAVTPAPAPETAAPAAAEPEVATPAPRRAARTATRAPVRTAAPVRAPVRVTTAAPAATPETAAPAAAASPSAPAADVPSLAPAAPVPAPPPASVTTTDQTAAPAQTQNRGTSTWPWLLLGALLIAGGLFLFARRRRADVYDDVYESDRAETYAEPEGVAAPAAVEEPAPVMAAAVPVAAAAPLAADAGEAEIDLDMRPLRAGVAGDGARVEFQLTVGNSGSGPAQAVRVSTWMLAAGSNEMERALIEPRAEAADTPPVTIPAGESRTMEAAVALPTSQVEGDAVLPVVFADASWQDADGTEHHTRVSYAVGVPDGEELAHFATDNPSGLHEGVVARALGEPERA
jgi:LPXTG-motif cell wall-anchored protein